MIRDVIVPQSYNGYYIFPTKIVGIHITPHALYATVILSSGWNRTIKQHMYEPLSHTGETFAEQASNAIENITRKIGNYHKLHIALPSKDAIFKEITLPFVDQEKITMVAPFELEDTLPFNLEDAIVTTLPIQREAEQTTVLTATYRYDTVQSYLSAFEEHGLSPDLTTTDIIAYYNAFYDMAEFLHSNEAIGYIDIDIHESRIFVIDHGALRVIRTVPHGVHNICDVSTESYNALQQSIQACSVDVDGVQSTQFAYDMQFTIAAANKILGPEKSISRIMLTGLGAHISNISQALATSMPITPEVMNANLPLRMPHVTTETNTHVPPVFMTSVATALPTTDDRSFHVRREGVTPRERDARTKQLLVATALSVIFFIGFFTYSVYTTRSLQSHLEQREQELRKHLVQTFELGRNKNAKFSYLINSLLPKKVSEEESIWFSLSRQKRDAFLYYLQELSNHIDRKELGLTLRKLTIQRDNKQATETMKMEGSVPSFPQLQKFEEALRATKLFTQVPSLQETKFDLTLTIEQSPGAS